VGKESFGELGIIQSTVMMMGVFAGFGTSMMTTKYVAEYRHSDTGKVGRIIGLSIGVSWLFGMLVSLLLFAGAPLIAAQTISAPHLSALLKVSALYLLISSVNGTQLGALAGFEAFATISKINMILGAANLLIIGIGVYCFGLMGAIWGNVFVSLFNYLLCEYALKRLMHANNIRADYRRCLEELKILWKYCLPAMLANSLVAPVTWVCNVMLVNQPNGLAEMGVYNAATQWRQMMLFLPGLIAQVALPIMASTAQSSTQQQIRLNFRINLIVTVPLLLILSLASPVILKIYGNSFADSWLVFVLVMCAAFLQVLQSPIVTYWAATGRMWANFMANLFWGFSLIVLSRLFIHKGALGISLALVSSFAIYGVLLLIIMHNMPQEEL
jgi:O-antigen/teichoic acid export membrane protein